jgi:hypothetical protein
MFCPPDGLDLRITHRESFIAKSSGFGPQSLSSTSFDTISSDPKSKWFKQNDLRAYAC